LLARGLIGVLIATGLLGCGSDGQSVPSTAAERTAADEPTLTAAGQSCFDAWNAAWNAGNRERVAGTFVVASVSMWDAEDDGASDAGAQGECEYDGCSYVFHDDERSLEFTGRWAGDDLLWDRSPQQGSWTPESDAAVRDEASVAADGRIGFSPEP